METEVRFSSQKTANQMSKFNPAAFWVAGKFTCNEESGFLTQG